MASELFRCGKKQSLANSTRKWNNYNTVSLKMMFDWNTEVLNTTKCLNLQIPFCLRQRRKVKRGKRPGTVKSWTHLSLTFNKQPVFRELHNNFNNFIENNPIKNLFHTSLINWDCCAGNVGDKNWGRDSWLHHSATGRGAVSDADHVTGDNVHYLLQLVTRYKPINKVSSFTQKSKLKLLRILFTIVINDENAQVLRRQYTFRSSRRQT